MKITHGRSVIGIESALVSKNSGRNMLSKPLARVFLTMFVAGGLAGGLSGCIGTAIEATTDTVIAVGKIPFKVGGAVVDVATDDDDKGEAKEDKRPQP